MRRLLALAVGTGLVFGALALAPARAQDKPAMALDARHVINAMVLSLRSKEIDPKIIPVQFSDVARSQLAEVGFAFDGFFFLQARLAVYEAIEDAPNSRKIVGHLVFQDVGNRRIILGFVATYSVEANRIVVWEATTGTVTPDTPTVAWYVLPSEILPPGFFTQNGHAQILEFATEYALGALDPLAMATPGNYTIVGFALDRLAEGDSLEFTATITGQDPVALYTANFNGWYIGAFSGAFAPADLGPGLQLSALLATAELRAFGAAVPIATLAAMPANPYKPAPAP
ncbi:MAG: hypothetical protein HN719_09105 [Alphaproteobacteria bacterium]|jgi:hypothetical protein|nr:hypothetical protein [Alphaproteobacteria bacterium]